MSLIRGVLLAGNFRTQHELNKMSHEDHRNTLIVEMAGHSNQSGKHFQGMDDDTLAGVGAVMVFLREGRIRSDENLKTMSDDDQRNTLIVEVNAQTGLGSQLQSLSNLNLVLEGLGLTPLEDAKAANSMSKFYQRTGGSFGPLGIPVRPPERKDGTSYVQEYQLGSLHLNDFSGNVEGTTHYEAEVALAAVHCFGTQDRNRDEPYVVMSLITIDPNNPNRKVQTQRTQILNNVPQGATIFKNEIVMQQPISGQSGIMIHLAVWDHESGDQDEIRDQINKVLQDSASKAASALAGGDMAGKGGMIGDIMNFEVGGIKPFQLLTLGISGLLAGALADDLLGEHTYVIPPQNIIDLSDQSKFDASIRPNGPNLDFDVQFNWPPRAEDEFVFTDGHGTYKVFLRVAGVKTVKPILPRL